MLRLKQGVGQGLHSAIVVRERESQDDRFWALFDEQKYATQRRLGDRDTIG